MVAMIFVTRRTGLQNGPFIISPALFFNCLIQNDDLRGKLGETIIHLIVSGAKRSKQGALDILMTGAMYLEVQTVSM